MVLWSVDWVNCIVVMAEKYLATETEILRNFVIFWTTPPSPRMTLFWNSPRVFCDSIILSTFIIFQLWFNIENIEIIVVSYWFPVMKPMIPPKHILHCSSLTWRNLSREDQEMFSFRGGRKTAEKYSGLNPQNHAPLWPGFESLAGYEPRSQWWNAKYHKAHLTPQVNLIGNACTPKTHD